MFNQGFTHRFKFKCGTIVNLEDHNSSTIQLKNVVRVMITLHYRDIAILPVLLKSLEKYKTISKNFIEK